MEIEQIAVGKSVRLLSGGPVMTISSALLPFGNSVDRPAGTVTCQWFMKRGRLGCGNFHPSCLEEVGIHVGPDTTDIRSDRRPAFRFGDAPGEAPDANEVL